MEPTPSKLKLASTGKFYITLSKDTLEQAMSFPQMQITALSIPVSVNANNPIKGKASLI